MLLKDFIKQLEHLQDLPEQDWPEIHVRTAGHEHHITRLQLNALVGNIEIWIREDIATTAPATLKD